MTGHDVDRRDPESSATLALVYTSTIPLDAAQFGRARQHLGSVLGPEDPSRSRRDEPPPYRWSSNLLGPTTKAVWPVDFQGDLATGFLDTDRAVQEELHAFVVNSFVSLWRAENLPFSMLCWTLELRTDVRDAKLGDAVGFLNQAVENLAKQCPGHYRHGIPHQRAKGHLLIGAKVKHDELERLRFEAARPPSEHQGLRWSVPEETTAFGAALAQAADVFRESSGPWIVAGQANHATVFGENRVLDDKFHGCYTAFLFSSGNLIPSSWETPEPTQWIPTSLAYHSWHAVHFAPYLMATTEFSRQVLARAGELEEAVNAIRMQIDARSKHSTKKPANRSAVRRDLVDVRRRILTLRGELEQTEARATTHPLREDIETRIGKGTDAWAVGVLDDDELAGLYGHPWLVRQLIEKETLVEESRSLLEHLDDQADALQRLVQTEAEWSATKAMLWLTSLVLMVSVILLIVTLL